MKEIKKARNNLFDKKGMVKDKSYQKAQAQAFLDFYNKLATKKAIKKTKNEEVSMPIQNFTVGKFKIGISGGYPVWTRLSYDHGNRTTEIAGIDHRDLSDLEYAIKKVRKIAKERVGRKNENEV